MLRIAVLLSLALMASRAGADEDANKKEARAHFRAGVAFFEARDYDQAISEYSAAYRLLPLPEFLFDLGQAHRLKGDGEGALAFYRRYLEAQPSSRFSAEAREHVSALEAARRPGAPMSAGVASARSEPPATRRRWVWLAVGGAALVVAGVAIGVGVGLGARDRDPAPSWGTAAFR